MSLKTTNQIRNLAVIINPDLHFNEYIKMQNILYMQMIFCRLDYCKGLVFMS